MRKLLPTLLLAAGPALAQQAAPSSYLIEGTLGKLNVPAKVYLVNWGERINSATLHNGHFEMRGTHTSPATAELVLERGHPGPAAEVKHDSSLQKEHRASLRSA